VSVRRRPRLKKPRLSLPDEVSGLVLFRFRAAFEELPGDNRLAWPVFMQPSSVSRFPDSQVIYNAGYE
jgi:hypothetical protein